MGEDVMMGGLHSGRKRLHGHIADCVALDLATLKKQNKLTPGTHTLRWTLFTLRNFHEVRERPQSVNLIVTEQGEQKQLLLAYNVISNGETTKYRHPLNLITTKCNYGGQRYWFRSPCCGRKVRVLYISTLGTESKPRCRSCSGLHYASQSASFVERHRTYERYLLANYGCCWARKRYEELPVHYLKRTPGVWRLRLKSMVETYTEISKEIVKCDNEIYQHDAAFLRAARTEEERRLGIKQMVDHQRQLQTSLVLLSIQLIIEYEYLLMMRDLGLDFQAQLQRCEQMEAQIEQLEALPEPTEQEIEQKVIDLTRYLQKWKLRKKKAA